MPRLTNFSGCNDTRIPGNHGYSWQQGGTHVQHRHLHDLAQLLDLLLAAADVAVGHIGLVLDLHHRYARVDLRWQRDVDLVLGAVDAAMVIMMMVNIEEYRS